MSSVLPGCTSNKSDSLFDALSGVTDDEQAQKIIYQWKQKNPIVLEALSGSTTFTSEIDRVISDSNQNHLNNYDKSNEKTRRDKDLEQCIGSFNDLEVPRNIVRYASLGVCRSFCYPTFIELE